MGNRLEGMGLDEALKVVSEGTRSLVLVITDKDGRTGSSVHVWGEDIEWTAQELGRLQRIVRSSEPPLFAEPARTLEYRPPGHPHRDEMDELSDNYTGGDMADTPAWLDENCQQAVMTALREAEANDEFENVIAVTGVAGDQLLQALREGTQVLSPTEFVAIWKHVR